MKLIDVSEHQGKIDWKKVKNDGIEGVIIRAGFGRGNRDAQLTNNLNGAKANGLHIGIYWFSYAYTASMAKNEAYFCHEAIKDYKDSIDLPVFFDWEYDSMRFAKTKGVKPTRQNITDWNKVFCEEIKGLGFTPGYYCNLDYSKNYIDCNQLKDYKLWWAQYTKTEKKDNYIWQYSDKGKVNGISGNVDMDTLWSFEPDKPVEPVNPDIAGKTTEELAKEVIEGKYGNDEARKKALGDRYDEVQALVNQMLAKPVVKYGYEIGKTYKVIATKGLNIRTGAGMGFTRIGKYNYGDKVTIEDAKKVGTETWVKTSRGWACAVGKGKYIG